MAIQKSFLANFKKTRNGAHAGEKRDSVNVDYLALEVSDVAKLDQNDVVKVLNDCIIGYGKRLLTENSDNWNYVPSDLSFDSFIADFNAPSARGNRILSKEKLTAIAVTYELYAVETLNKSEAAGRTGGQVIMSKFSIISGNQKMLAVMAENLSEMTVSEDLQLAYDALIELLSELMSVEITEDSL